MLVEVIQPVISVSLKHLVNFHFCRTIINPFNSTVYSKNFSVPLPSKALFCSIETALLEVVKNPICCSQISLYPIRNCDPVHVCLFSESWGCVAGPRSAEHWGAGIRRGTSALKLLSHWGADSNCIRVMFWNTNPHALFSTLLHVTFPQWSAHQLWEKQDRKGQKQWMSFSFRFCFFNLQHRLWRPLRQAWGKQGVNFVPTRIFERVLYLICGRSMAFRDREKWPWGAGWYECQQGPLSDPL